MKNKFLNIFLPTLLAFTLVGCAGEMGPQGPQGEQGIQGEKGEQGQPGKDGVDGQNGVDGKDGTSLLTGNGEPTNIIGIVGDSYIDLDTWSFYIKTTNGWVISGNIKGEKGDSATPDHNGTEGLEFYPLNDKECAVAIGTALFCEEIVVPSYYKNYTVTSLLGGAFLSSVPEGLKIQKIYIPKTIKSIEKNSIAYLSSLVEVGIEEGSQLTTIGNRAFYRCSNLRSINLPDGVTSIGDSAFQGCSSLESITIPEGVTSIGDSAFRGCEALLNVVVKEDLKTIGDYAFYGCNKLEQFEIPSSVESIGNYTFGSCEALESITIPEGVTSIGENALEWCENLSSITLPSTLTTIGREAFIGCKSITNIVIPEGVTKLEYLTFANCSSLIDIVLPSSITYIQQSTFGFETVYENLYYNGSIEDWCNINFNDGAPMEHVNNFYILDDNGTEMYNGKKYSLLTKIEISNDVTSIPEWAFNGCKTLESVVILDGVTSIGSYAFANCSNISNVILPNKLTSIGSNAFVGCVNLKFIVIPESVTEMGSHIFYNCTDLTIYCESKSKPEGWYYSWNYSGPTKCYFAGQWEYDANGNPVPLS